MTSVDLAHALPLTGRRFSAKVVVAVPVVAVVAGILGAVVAGHDSAWVAPLSIPWPGLAQLVQTRWLIGVPLALVALAAWVYSIMRSGGWTLMVLVPVAVIDAATLGWVLSLPVGVLTGFTTAALIGQVNLARRRAHERTFAKARAEATVTATDTQVGSTPAHLEPVVSAPAPPVDGHLVAFHRWFSHFGHAAPDDWTVFDDPKHVDSALRYQLALAAWAIHHYQHQYTPAFRQSAATSLGNLTERGRDLRVWGYTKRINLKAFRLDGDPFARENVMYSGYIANMISMYEAMSGDDRYDRPGGYAVSDGRRTYDWDHGAIIEALAVQHATSAMGSITCVPGFMWPPCQTFSLRAIQLADLVHGTDHGWAIERCHEAFRRFFVDENGRIDTCRHVTGVIHPIDAVVVGISAQAATAAWLSTFGADLTERTYETQVRARMNRPDAAGRITLRLGKMDTYDTSYGFNPCMPYSMALLHATEIGDTESAAGLRRQIETMLTPDGERPGPGSIVSMALTYTALANSERALAAGHRKVPARGTGPELESAPYPEVLVTKATTDGAGVSCELVPGPAGNGNVELTFARLRAGGRYRLTVGDGSTSDLDADAAGRVRCKVGSSKVQALTLAPAGGGP